ncbi:hypothetical protein [Priestia megaterium]|uniref:hypothetical protein n=1 Tax=Priestia megaterium TaxID=1404 RepID=UPI0032423981
MGSNGFSSERKQKRVDLLKQLLDTNISTQGSSNPLEALLSGLDLGSLEGLMQKNKKSHHDDWDSKKKRHHDDCSDHDWDHKKKHDHDDCGCKKKKHDHDDCGCKKKKHDHDDCGCKKKKHDHDDCCDCKDKKRCKCPDVVACAVCNLIGQIFDETNRSELISLLTQLSNRLKKCKIREGLLIRLSRLIAELNAGTGPVSPDLLARIAVFLEDLLECLGFEVGDCGSSGGGGGGEVCNCPPGRARALINAILAVIAAIPNPLVAPIPPTSPFRTALGQLVTLLSSPPIVACVSATLRGAVATAITAVLEATTVPVLTEALILLRTALNDLFFCLLTGSNPGRGGAAGLTDFDFNADGVSDFNDFLFPIPNTPVNLVATTRQRLTDLLADQVVITTPTGLYAGTLVAVEADYIAVVAPTGTYLIPLDQIQTFTTE